MATRRELEDISELKDNYNTLDKRTDLMKQDIGYIKRDLRKVVDFVDANKGGISTASLLNNRIVTIVIGGIIAAGVYFIGKAGL